MTLADPTFPEVIEAIRGLDADDEMTDVIVNAIERLTAREPLAIIWVGGGLVQDEHLKPGFGTPRLFDLDFDREGQTPDELEDFVGFITRARDALAEYNDRADEKVLENLNESIEKFQRYIDEDEDPPRYR